MNLLAIDTTTEYASVALFVKGELQSEEQSARQSHARMVLPMIQGLLAQAGWQMSQLDAIVFGRGPGSFTGLRIACSVAKGLAYAHDLPLYPVSSLAAIANEALTKQAETSNQAVLSLIDARMNQLYWAYFSESEVHETTEQVSHASAISLNTDKPLLVAGFNYEPYLQQLSSSIREKVNHYLPIYPKAEAMIRLVLSGAVKRVSAADALPVYVRNQITHGETHG